MKVYVETYGCTANKSDERLVIGLLTQDNHEIVRTIEKADVLVLLSCTVIGTTEQRMLSRLHIFQKTKKPIIVTGCLPVVQPALVLRVAPSAVMVSPQRIHDISSLVNGNHPTNTDTKKPLGPKQYNGVVAPVLIAEGCTKACSYCITRFARGTLHSFSIQEINSDVCAALAQGCKEIQLTAQDTAAYGFDQGTDIGQLLSSLTSIEEQFRIRVGMMNPTSLKHNLTKIISGFSHEKVYKFLHLPLQSGDDTILQKMNRGYTVEDFCAIVETFRQRYHNLTLSTDVIVGFPTETEKQFKKTVQLLIKIQPDIINITRFSARPHTPAKTMRGRIPTEIVKKRSIYLTTFCKKITKEKNKQHKHKQYIVLVTEQGKHNSYMGRTNTYKPVVLHEQVTLGNFYRVEITDTTPTHLFGKLI